MRLFFFLLVMEKVEVQAIAQTAIEGGGEWFVIEQDDHVHGEPMDR